MRTFPKPAIAAALVAALVLCFSLLAAPRGGQDSGASHTPGQEGEEFRGMWVATVYRLDYPTAATTDPARLKADADEILQNCVDMGMTAVILQVRPSADALYPSEYYPWSRYLTGTAGTAPAGGFDPLEYWVERAHALGLELHAWINPFRVTKQGQGEFDALPSSHPAVLHPDWVVQHEGEYYFNPGLPEVREYIIKGAEELVRNYPIDGVHLDDYFYPGSGFDDGATYAQYGGGFSDLGDWRRDNVNQLVKQLGERLHAIDPALSYGISPSGVWADKSSLPQGSNTTGGYESYYAAYADSRKWVKEGWIDYICPQIYWYIGHKSMDYATIARWWADTVEGTGVSLYIGMADYQAGNADPTSPWHGVSAIQAQLALNDTLPQVAGEVHFRYRLMADNPDLVELYRETYGAQGIFPSQPEETPGEEIALGTNGSAGYIQGSQGLFRPEAPLTRSEAVAILARLTVDKQGNSLYSKTEEASGFSDVSADAWYAPYVAFAHRWGIAGGYPDGSFRPDRAVSRSELVKLLCAYYKVEGGAASFSDVPSSHWASQVISFATRQGWLTGYPDGTFRPEQSVSRAEAVTLINRVLGLAEREGELGFLDVSTGHWAYGAILAASRPA